MDFIKTKTILTKVKYGDTWYGVDYNMNLYRGCSHGCIYCDSRSNCYHIDNFDVPKGKENALQILDIFKLLKKTADISEKEMLRTFNLGVGLTVVCKKQYANDIIKHMKNHKINAYVIGNIIKGNKTVIVNGEFNWD